VAPERPLDVQPGRGARGTGAQDGENLLEHELADQLLAPGGIRDLGQELGLVGRDQQCVDAVLD